MKRSNTFLAFLFLSAALSANAGLIGTNVTLDYHYQGQSTTDTFAVTAGTEVSCFGGGSGNANVCSILQAPNQTLDFGDNTITYTYTRIGSYVASFLPSNPNGFDFLNLNLGQPIQHVLLSSSIQGLDASRLTFTANSIQLNMYDLPLGEHESFTLTIVTNPEPSAGLLGGLGLLLVSARFVRRKRT
ncbi:MAG: hypothetical protein ABIR70_09510 [Bryobacteraceae bacterium]